MKCHNVGESNRWLNCLKVLFHRQCKPILTIHFQRGAGKGGVLWLGV